jgi:hypothetical protein
MKNAHASSGHRSPMMSKIKDREAIDMYISTTFCHCISLVQFVVSHTFIIYIIYV